MKPFRVVINYVNPPLVRLFCLCLLLAGCAYFEPINPVVIPALVTNPPDRITPTPFQPASATPAKITPPTTPQVKQEASPTEPVDLNASPTAGVNQVNSSQLPGLWVAPYLPPTLRDDLVVPAGFSMSEGSQGSAIRLEVGDQIPLTQWIYTLVAPFPTIPDGVSGKDLSQSWKGESRGSFAGLPLLVDENTLGVLEAFWGKPATGSVQTLPSDELLGYAWDHRPSWAIIPFEDLEPRWKVLEVDGQSPLHKDFDPDKYALTVSFSLEGDSNLARELLNDDRENGSINLGLPETNRQPDKLTTLVMTGVTALVRATAFTMNRNGVLYPALDIGDVLREADLTHISNEIPFTTACPPPNPTQVGLVFCSDPSYIALLEDIGTDIVELTGDHFGDWGPDAMRYTLDLYRKEGWVYYGGGYNRNDARQARLVENNGNHLAFIGCNAKGGGYATASENTPGAVSCDYDWMHNEIDRLTKAGNIVIATFQHFEYYTYFAQPDQIVDFRGMAQAGAAVVSGSQAHQPQGMEFYKGAFIHYGLGNLFFDQYNYCADLACNYAFIDRHVFYDNRYLGTELITIQFQDYARPRLMTPEERSALLQVVFSASNW